MQWKITGQCWRPDAVMTEENQLLRIRQPKSQQAASGERKQKVNRVYRGAAEALKSKSYAPSPVKGVMILRPTAASGHWGFHIRDRGARWR